MKEKIHSKKESVWRKRARLSPAGPGVYIMRSREGKALYIGKAKSLRVRLRSYCDPSRRGPRTTVMLRQVENIELLITDTEMEALILENSLIKELKPKYNITLRDDKTFPFLRLSLQEEFPTLTVVRRPADDGARYFGPFVPAGAMRRTLRVLQKIIPLRRCRQPLRGGGQRPCLNYQMGNCLAPCAGKVDARAYRKMVRQVTLFLQGRGRELAGCLRRQMVEMAQDERYEEAAVLRDRIEAIEATLERQKVHFPGRGDMDVLGTAQLGRKRAVSVLHASHGRIIGAKTYRIDVRLDDDSEVVADFLRAFYDGAAKIPPEILLPLEPEGEEVLTAWLGEKRKGRVVLRVPRLGLMRSLVAMASKNALAFLERAGAEPADGKAVIRELGRIAGVEGRLASLAAIDASNLSGSDAVASLVWWEAGRFVKKRFRHFRIKSSAGSDDCAMISETVERLAERVDSGEWPGPDVLLLDGGKGQLSAGRAALAKTDWQPVLLLAIAKPARGRAADAVFASGRRNCLDLNGDSPVLKLLQEIRDEAHRFALTYHRSLRQRRHRRSTLDEVPGVGPARRKILMRRFGSLSKMREASLDELASVPGLPQPVAETLFRYLNGRVDQGEQELSGRSGVR